MTRGRIIWGAILAALIAAGWVAGRRFFYWLTPELYVTLLVALGCAFVAARSIVEMLSALRARRPIDKGRLAFGLVGSVVGLVGVWFYWKGVLHPGAATLSWQRHGTDYELLGHAAAQAMLAALDGKPLTDVIVPDAAEWIERESTGPAKRALAAP